MLKLIFAFDVESIGLHGEGFAVGGGLYDISDGLKTISEFLFVSSPEAAFHVVPSDREWINKNIPSNILEMRTHADIVELRNEFWEKWMIAKNKGAIMFADCCWPVEARFLNECIDDPFQNNNGVMTMRYDQGPYPLLDLSNFLIAVGLDPLANYERNANELPKHNPLCDARQSVRKLEECWRILKKNYE